jgi:hypothetical protein
MQLCMKCKAKTAIRVHRNGAFDRIAHFLGFSPYECPDCNRRFRRFRFAPLPPIPLKDRGVAKEIRKTRRQLQFSRLKKEISIYSLAGLVLAMFLYMISKERW